MPLYPYSLARGFLVHRNWGRILGIQEETLRWSISSVVSYTTWRYRRSVERELQEGPGIGQEDDSSRESQYYYRDGLADGSGCWKFGACCSCWLPQSGVSGRSTGVE